MIHSIKSILALIRAISIKSLPCTVPIALQIIRSQVPIWFPSIAHCWFQFYHQAVNSSIYPQFPLLRWSYLYPRLSLILWTFNHLLTSYELVALFPSLSSLLCSEETTTGPQVCPCREMKFPHSRTDHLIFCLLCTSSLCHWLHHPPIESTHHLSDFVLCPTLLSSFLPPSPHWAVFILLSY